jgi:hypothetical protein
VQRATSPTWEHAAPAWITGAVVLALVLVLAYLWKGKHVSRHWAVLYGKDGRRSTSILAAFAWTVALVSGGATLLAAALFNGAVTVESLGLDAIPEEYLVLIGVPYGTAVLSAGIVQGKVNAGTLQKSVVDASTNEGGFSADDRGNADLVDLQYLAFNALLLFYFVAALIQDRRLPDLPLALVGLTGAGAATYVARKGVESNPPVIDSASVSGTKLRVRGKNLLRPVDAAGVPLVGADLLPYVVVDGVDTVSVTWTADGLVDAVLSATPATGARVSLTSLGGATVERTIGP